jgi:DNA-binding beta-propeller fold protein YncE
VIRALAVAALLALALAPAAGAAPFEWIDASDVIVSPDGRNVYAGGGRTFSFRVARATGALELIGHTEPGSMGSQLAISPDGRFVYMGRGQNFPAGAIVVMSRDAGTGLLTHEETFMGDGRPGSSAIGPIADVEVSPDGRQLYVAERGPDLVAVFDRDPATGALAQRQALYARADLPSTTVGDLAVAGDGRHVYLAGDRIVTLRRDAADGSLAPAGTADRGAGALAVSGDGRFVYSGRDGLDGWRRDPENGALTHVSHADLPGGGGGGTFVAVAPDGRTLLTAERPEPVLHQAGLSEGDVTYERSYGQGQDGLAGLDHPRGAAWSPDGGSAYVTASQGFRNSTLAAFRRAGGGLAPAGVAGPAFEASFDPYAYVKPAVTIDGGALYTNDPDVEVTIIDPQLFSSLRLSNTTDFTAAPAQRVFGAEQTFPWRLATSGPERSVRRVHVRFTPHDANVVQIFDDIILDQRPPEVLAARLEGARLRLRARDNRSGVKRLQVTASRKKPGRAREYRRSVRVSPRTRTLHVRVFDGAGNASRWQIARRP